ncbi:MAG: (2Fe-2S) ferredoxin domain-containing protein [Candidatus Caldatribacteriaceae bacterium]
MVTISVCVGSSCHLKGAYEIIRVCAEMIERLKLKDRVELKGTFCLGQCTEEGVTVVIDGEILHGVSAENFEEIFTDKVLPKIAEESLGNH